MYVLSKGVRWETIANRPVGYTGGLEVVVKIAP
jgi:hypothetical protein